jgi:cobalt-zinc-cadmium efflux system membrane fusion protein
MNRLPAFRSLLAVAVLACGGPPPHDDHPHHDADDRERPQAAEPAGTVPSEAGAEAGAHLPLDGLVGVAFVAVGAPIEEGAWYAAEAVADESTRVALASPVEGIVARLIAPPGREVGAGAPLAEIRSPELARLVADRLAARAELERAEAEAGREERLAAVGATSTRELEAARAAARVARAAEEAADLALAARGVEPGSAGAVLVVRAPRAGRVAGWTVLAGAGVAPGQELGLFDAGRATRVRVELALPGAAGWEPGTTTRVRRSDGVEWTARVEGLPMSLSPETRRLAYRLRLEGPDPPLAGTPLEARVPLPPGIVLPQTALQQIEGTWGVFVARGDEAEFRAVRRGPELGGDVVVLAGVAPGERVATDGAYLLKALHLKRSGGGEAHEH